MLTTGLLTGTIIGAGIFSLPYILGQVGILTGFFYLAFFAAVYFAIHLMYAQVLQTETGRHQFFHFAEKYLPRGVSKFASIVILAELLLVLTVYLTLAPTFAALVFGPSVGSVSSPQASSGLTALLIFWFLGSVFIFVKLFFLDWVEFLGTLVVLGIVLIIFFSGVGASHALPLAKKISWPLFFLPFGPLLFSLSGRPAISKVVEQYRRLKSRGKNLSLSKVIFWGTAISALIYFLFALSILRLNPRPTEEALNSLGFLPPAISVLLGFLGLLALWDSYFIIGANVRDILRLDLKKSAVFSAAVVLAAPLLLYFFGFKNYLSVIGFTGGVFLSLEGIFVIAMWRKAFPKNKWRGIAMPLYLVFLAAMAYEVISFVF